MITNTITYIEWMPTQWEYDNIIKPQQDAEEQALLEQMYDELQELYYMTDDEINEMLNQMYEEITDDDLKEEFELVESRHPCEHMR